MKRHLLAIGFLICFLGVSTNAQAQWKTIPCDQVKFKASIPFQKCDYQLGGLRELWTGAFHDENSSAFVAVYTSPRGMSLETGEVYALGAAAYRPFLQRYPSRSQLKSQGKYLSFPAVVKTPTGDRTMNCTQFFKPGPPKGVGYHWTWVALMCVNSGETPEAVADLISDSIKVNIK